MGNVHFQQVLYHGSSFWHYHVATLPVEARNQVEVYMTDQRI